ncbi:ATP-dependent RNA helicase DDX51 [Ceratina calcarata]|uniref:ATP-dependent RNA helicase n=1 Tax=Ceratina calcarata TaxID=156304 RepID=A0AAJ7JF78_9HYME|nr:ATP-dependent RNA helicase DDX51 [Ceratina calcarata]
MSLFVINRYEGEKKEADNETNHLSRLLKRIEERKEQKSLQQAQTQTQSQSNLQDDSIAKPQKKKRKIKRNEEENSANIIKSEQSHEFSTEIKYEETQIESEDKNQRNVTNLIRNEAAITDKEIKSIDNVNEESKSQISTDFIILGSKSNKKPKEVKRVLPEWLSNPEIISRDLDSGPSLDNITNSLLDEKMIELLKGNQMEKLFPVQECMLKWLTKSDEERRRGFWTRDVCVSAPTGSGKTLAYVLPVIQLLKSRLVPKIRCLVVVPVQELAAQVHKVMVTYAASTDLKVALLSGASSFHQEQNNIVKKNSRGEYVSLVDVVIATPGRLIDHIFKTAGFSLDDLRFLVIDEADKNADWLEYIPERHYKPPKLSLANMRDSKMPAQKLLFSATLTQDPEKLSRLGLLRPILFTSVLITNKDGDVDLDKESGDFIGRYTSPEELEEEAVECSSEFKPVALYYLLTNGRSGWKNMKETLEKEVEKKRGRVEEEQEEEGKLKQEKQTVEETFNQGVKNEKSEEEIIEDPKRNRICKTLIFTNSADTAHRLSLLLKSMLKMNNVSVGELSAKFSPKERENVLKNFVEDKIQILICSDALARGMDIPSVQLVVSYDLPKHIKGYIHRAGRTGRAGKKGTAISILTTKQAGLFKHMLTTAHKRVPLIQKLENLDTIAGEINFEKHLENLKNVLELEKRNQFDRAKSAKRKN